MTASRPARRPLSGFPHDEFERPVFAAGRDPIRMGVPGHWTATAVPARYREGRREW